MMQTFEAEQWVPYLRTLVFAFFAQPRHLPPLMPGWQKARIDRALFRPPPLPPEGTPRYPGVLAGDGTKLTITARGLPLLPLRGRWDALIEDFRWNEGFCDVQLRGPFSYWKHCHSVCDAASPQDGSPGTMVHDHVCYELPLSPLSSVGLPLSQATMAALFRFRQARTSELLPLFAKAARDERS